MSIKKSQATLRPAVYPANRFASIFRSQISRERGKRKRKAERGNGGKKKKVPSVTKHGFVF